MLKAFLNIFKIADLRNKLLFTFAMLAIYRIGFFVPLPAVDQSELARWAESQSQGAGGNLLTYVSIFTGGSLSQSTIFGLGIMPYISAAIIFQLLQSVVPTLQELKKEGATGQQKITEWTRYTTVGLCIIQAVFWLRMLYAQDLVISGWSNTPAFWISGVVGLTAGTIFLMWLGEQIDKYGIGNGVSLIITAGIVAQLPNAIMMIASNFSLEDATATYGVDTVIFLAIAFVAVVAGAIIITQGQRRIPIQQAKHTRGRKVYGGQKTYLPLRVNHGGVMPIIFASSLLIFPSVILGGVASFFPQGSWFLEFLNRNLAMDGTLHLYLYIGLIYFFAYFWTTVQFNPPEMAKNLRDSGNFIPGLRPGPRTAEYLETVMERITYVGASFLSIIAVIPSIVASFYQINFAVATFLGGTGLLIVVSVMLDFVQRVEANLLMRNYQGFLGGEGSGKGPRIRGARPT